MSGTKEGGRKARDKNLAKDPNFYQTIGALGGKAGRTGGFAAKTICLCTEIPGQHIKPQCAGMRGGRISRRGSLKQEQA